MASLLLPSTTYHSNSQRAGKLQLNTIMEVESPVMGNEAETREKRRRRMTDSPSSTYSPASASTISSYYQSSRQSREFDDLYDVSDQESDQESRPGLTINLKRASIASSASDASSWAATTPTRKHRFPSLVIPSPRHWPTIDNFKKNSPVPPTPPSKIPISPAVLSKLPNVVLSSAPPSLDGSLTSDQAATSSAPPTPEVSYNPLAAQVWGEVEIARSSAEFAEDSGPQIEVEYDATNGSMGVQLPAGALDILQHLEFDGQTEDATPNTTEPEEFKEMQEIGIMLQRAPSPEGEPMSAISEYSMTAISLPSPGGLCSQLEVPSPGGFFSSLSSQSRNTWGSNEAELMADIPPSSTTAEHFYNAPWNTVSTTTPCIVERTVETDDAETEGPPTAVRIPLSPQQNQKVSTELRLSIDETVENDEDSRDSRMESISTLEEIDRSSRAEVEAESTFDRINMWAAAQSSYLSALGESNPANETTDAKVKAASVVSEEITRSNTKKTVKFLDTEAANAPFKASPTKSDPLFYQAFQSMTKVSSPTDSFIHRHARFDAIQALRSSLRESHIDTLLGNYQTIDTERPNPKRPISTFPGKEPTEDEEEEEVKAALNQWERERQALDQVAPAMWIVEAMRFLSNGRLLNSPAADILGRAQPLATSTPPEHVRVLDLGGQAQCDWAWFCAREYPNVKTYTATCDSHVNYALRGPSNHRLVSVDNLYTLPFPDNHFDVISARTLPMFLHTRKTTSGTDSNGRDEYDRCLKECLRCLKPGGYLEFFLLDSEIVLAGQRGTAASVEFGFNLKARGYDPAPTKTWLARVRRAGLVDIKRAWMFLPIGAIREEEARMPETPPPRQSTYEEGLVSVEAVQGPIGSKADVAHVSGLVGSCLWERWLLKLQMEMGKDKGLLDGVGSIVEEGKKTGAGWRCMSGWARKEI